MFPILQTGPGLLYPGLKPGLLFPILQTPVTQMECLSSLNGSFVLWSQQPMVSMMLVSVLQLCLL